MASQTKGERKLVFCRCCSARNARGIDVQQWYLVLLCIQLYQQARIIITTECAIYSLNLR